MAKPVRCARCGRENDPGLASCLDCGQPLRAAPASACASCGAALQPGFRFCGVCGKPVGAASPPQRAPRDPAVSAAGRPQAARPPVPPPSPPARRPRLRLTAMRADGTAGRSLPVGEGEVVCGRTEGDLRLPDDPTVSPRHARFAQADGVLRVEDLGSVNGTFLRLKAPRRLALGEEIRIGRQLLRLEPLPRPGHANGGAARPWGTPDPGFRLRLSQLLEGGGLGEIFPLREGENLVGREAGEVTFPSDRYVSARHARIVVAAGEVTLVDVGSSNGTFAKVSGPVELAPGDQLLVGGQLLRVDG